MGYVGMCGYMDVCVGVWVCRCVRGYCIAGKLVGIIFSKLTIS